MNYIDVFKKTAVSLGCDVKENEPMKNHTTFKVGGPADLLITVNHIMALKDIVRLANSMGVKFYIIGNGSNLLINDKGIKGIVINLGSDFRKISLSDDTKISCGAGTPLSSLCKFAEKNSLTGLEFAWGIPGSAGGAVFMNAGAYEGQMSDILLSVTNVSKTGKTISYLTEDLNFGYRMSDCQSNGCIITSLVIQLKKGNREEISSKMTELFNKRKTKQPLDFPSAGSTFKRPNGSYAGMLIEQCGLKGKQIGGAKISEKHAGFIINTGKASCSDIKNLIDIVQSEVLKQTGFTLEPEVRMI